jgi:short-subunit dehydrogenase
MKTTYALITGASSGIGKAFAHIHAQKGGHLILTGRNTESLQELETTLTKTYKVHVVVIAEDLSTPHAAQRIYDNIQSRGLEVGYLINNAGFGKATPFEQHDDDNISDMLSVNMEALTILTRKIGHDMVRRKSGYILNVSSIAGFMAGPGMAVYFATKNYVNALSSALRHEWKDKGVSVTTLCPGPTQSGFFDTAGMQQMKMVSFFSIPTADQVALFGYNSMMKRKGFAVHGLLNRMMVSLTAIMPKSLTNSVTAKMMSNA